MSEKIQAAILIPSLEPDDRLPAYVDSLREKGFVHVVVVDDGSSEKSQHIFDELDAREGVKVLHHDVNHGKGVALKTGYAYIAENLPECPGVITADADGQHTVTDCIRLAQALDSGKRAVYLGSRDFSLPNIPARSRFGNRTTSVVFKLFHGAWLPDTQTGLRAFRREELEFMRNVAGERYEYEMNVLIACAHAGIPMETLTIETVYENNNEGSHFHPLRDSWRIYKVILGSFFKYAGVAILSFLLDQLLAAMWGDWLLPVMGVTAAGWITFLSTCGSRPFSCLFNYLLNRRFVFESKSKVSSSAWKYAVLAVISATVSWLGTWLSMEIGLLRGLGKILFDVIMYFVNYRVQQAWVFRDPDAKEEQA